MNGKKAKQLRRLAKVLKLKDSSYREGYRGGVLKSRVLEKDSERGMYQKFKDKYVKGEVW